MWKTELQWYDFDFSSGDFGNTKVALSEVTSMKRAARVQRVTIVSQTLWWFSRRRFGHCEIVDLCRWIFVATLLCFVEDLRGVASDGFSGASRWPPAWFSTCQHVSSCYLLRFPITRVFWLFCSTIFLSGFYYSGFVIARDVDAEDGYKNSGKTFLTRNGLPSTRFRFLASC